MSRLQKTVIPWRRALLPMITIILLLALKSIATPMYATALGRFPAMMIEIMASRTLLFAWSPSGYYEDLFNAGHINRQQILFGNTTFVPDAYRLRRLRPNLANVTDWRATNTSTNRFGYIGPEWSIAKSPETRRVAVLGDSVPEGYGVNGDQGFVYLLSNRLNETAISQGSTQRFEFLNFSVSAYHLTQMLDVALQDVPQFHPDVYVVMLTELSVYRSWDTHLIYLEQSGVDLKYDFLRQVVSKQMPSNPIMTHLECEISALRMSIIGQTLMKMKSNAEQHQAQFLVVLLPAVEDADISRQAVCRNSRTVVRDEY